MTYTHCRGCGRPLRPEDRAEVDGVCIENGCQSGLIRWREAHKPAPERFEDDITRGDFWRLPEWSVAIDEWLAATR